MSVHDTHTHTHACAHMHVNKMQATTTTTFKNWNCAWSRQWGKERQQKRERGREYRVQCRAAARRNYSTVSYTVEGSRVKRERERVKVYTTECHDRRSDQIFLCFYAINPQDLENNSQIICLIKEITLEDTKLKNPWKPERKTLVLYPCRFTSLPPIGRVFLWQLNALYF